MAKISTYSVDIKLGKALLWARRASPDNGGNPIGSGIFTITAVRTGAADSTNTLCGIDWEEIR